MTFDLALSKTAGSHPLNALVSDHFVLVPEFVEKALLVAVAFSRSQ